MCVPWRLVVCCRRQDEGKLQQLSLAIEKLTQQVAAQKAALEAEITDTQVRAGLSLRGLVA